MNDVHIGSFKRQALEKLSHEHGSSCLRNGGLVAVLTYLDFFPMGVQRVALATAANMCKDLSSNSFDMIRDAVPILIQCVGCFVC